ncbi:MAG: hypothetical protein HOE14_00710 [Gemmatimonadales bacterium]|jgi:hypothetical protein|nr:hypothetical protein [Gemmatimonadales bacterium]
MSLYDDIYDREVDEIMAILDLPESPLRAPVRVPTVIKSGCKSREVRVLQIRGARPPVTQTRFTMTAPW